MSLVELIVADDRVARKQRSVQKMTRPARSSAVFWCAVWNTANSAQLSTVLVETSERSDARDRPGGVAVWHLWLNNILFFCVCTRILACVWERFTRCTPETRHQTHQLPCLLLPAFFQQWSAVAHSKWHWGTREAAPCSYEKIFSGDMASNVPMTPTSTYQSLDFWICCSKSAFHALFAILVLTLFRLHSIGQFGFRNSWRLCRMLNVELSNGGRLLIICSFSQTVWSCSVSEPWITLCGQFMCSLHSDNLTFLRLSVIFDY